MGARPWRRVIAAVAGAALILGGAGLTVSPALAEDASPRPTSSTTAPAAPTTGEQTVVVAPGAPTILNVRGGLASGQLSITYAPPASDGGSSVTSYEASIDQGAVWWPCAGVTGECVLTNLRNGTQYRVALRAVNALGPGAPSQPATGVPTIPVGVDPDKPTQLPKPRAWVGATFNAASNGLGVDGAQVRLGVGTLPAITFTRAIPDKRVVETHLGVSAVLPDGKVRKVSGAWGWTSDRTAVFRPVQYWPGHATIMVTSTLDRAVLGRDGTTYLVGKRDLAKTWTFRTDRKLIARVDGAKVNMRVYIDGQRVETFPVSLGKDGWETRNGVKVISTQKEPVKIYRSTSLGLGPEEAYELEADWNTRLTPTGEFIHTATWAYGRIGRYNGSHGCTNMIAEDAQWIYQKTIPGDVILYENTGGTTVQEWNGPGGLWNIPWSQWLKKSALGSGSGQVDTSSDAPTSVTEDASA
ncbi:MAG TPA: hypothetical protein DCQ36_08755 [Actinobacteria bacterium]|nr:hypothetical protein [Actinomycetota bacterium]